VVKKVLFLQDLLGIRTSRFDLLAVVVGCFYCGGILIDFQREPKIVLSCVQR